METGLIVPPGKEKLALEYLARKLWSTIVNVQANQRVVVDAYKGVRKTVAWSLGEQFKELPPFQGGVASTRVVVAKVGGPFAAFTNHINCRDTAQLTRSSSGAAEVELNGKPIEA